MKRVLFVCVHNSGRSQMAEAFAGELGKDVIEAQSAGTSPGGELNPLVVQVMREIGFDMSEHYPKLMTDEMVDAADLVVTMGCGVSLEGDLAAGTCPAVLVPSENWALDDPHGQPIEKVRQIRDDVRREVEKLLKRFAAGVDSSPADKTA